MFALRPKPTWFSRISSVMLLAALLVGGCSTATTVGPTPAAIGITRDVAITIALAAARPGRNYDVLSAEAFPFGDVVPPSGTKQMKSPPPPGRLVWVVRLGEQSSPTGGQGEEIVVDSVDGRVILASYWAS